MQYRQKALGRWAKRRKFFVLSKYELDCLCFSNIRQFLYPEFHFCELIDLSRALTVYVYGMCFCIINLAELLELVIKICCGVSVPWVFIFQVWRPIFLQYPLLQTSTQFCLATKTPWMARTRSTAPARMTLLVSKRVTRGFLQSS